MSHYIAALPGRATSIRLVILYASFCLGIGVSCGIGLGGIIVAERTGLIQGNLLENRSPAVAPVFLVAFVLAGVYTWRVHQFIENLVPALRQAVQTSLIEKGLLQVVIADTWLDRLPNLIPPWMRTGLTARSKTAEFSLTKRLDCLLVTYEECCFDLGIGKKPTKWRDLWIIVIFGCAAVGVGIIGIQRTMTDFGKRYLAGLEPDYTIIYATLSIALVLALLPGLLFYKAGLHRAALNCALPLELAEILKQTPQASPPPPVN